VSAVGELYDRHHMRIFRYVWLHVRDEQLAEDLTGEVFVRMVTALPSYRQRGVPFQAWLYRIAHNLTTDHHRRAGLHEMVPLEHAEELSARGHDPSTIVEHRLATQEVQRALDSLDPLQREVVVLRFVAGLSLQEVGSTLDKTVPAVKSLQHRGLETLRAALGRGQPSLADPPPPLRGRGSR
jgi:RNA polymerase sigma-70 factor (ECF subfamily)